jgi:hypothetical protein
MGSIQDIANLFINAARGLIGTGSTAVNDVVDTGSAVGGTLLNTALGSVSGIVNG